MLFLAAYTHNTISHWTHHIKYFLFACFFMLFAQDSILCVGVYVSENKDSITLLLQLMVPVCVCVHTEQLSGHHTSSVVTKHSTSAGSRHFRQSLYIMTASCCLLEKLKNNQNGWGLKKSFQAVSAVVISRVISFWSVLCAGKNLVFICSSALKTAIKDRELSHDSSQSAKEEPALLELSK